MLRVGLITGTATLATHESERKVETPWGPVDVGVADHGPARIFHVRRHGRDAGTPPHRIRHRAHIDALAQCDVSRLVSLNTVGSLVSSVKAGTLLVPDDFLDLAAGPERTFHDERAVHADVSDPYCADVRASLLAAARGNGAPVRDGGVYAATAGPRLETRAEVRALATLGGTVVGMTGGAEAALARERGICHASLCLVTNAWAGNGAAPAREADVRRVATEFAPRVQTVALRAIAGMPHERRCRCARS